MFAMDRKQPTRTRPGNDRYSTFTTCQGCRGMSRIGPTPDLNRLLIQRAHRSQNSRFPGFQFPAGYVRCNHHPVAGAVRDMSSVRLFSPEWPALGCVSVVSIPLSSASTSSPARRLRRRLRQISVTTRRQLVEHIRKDRIKCANSGVD